MMSFARLTLLIALCGTAAPVGAIAQEAGFGESETQVVGTCRDGFSWRGGRSESGGQAAYGVCGASEGTLVFSCAIGRSDIDGRLGPSAATEPGGEQSRLVIDGRSIALSEGPELGDAAPGTGFTLDATDMRALARGLRAEAILPAGRLAFHLTGSSRAIRAMFAACAEDRTTGDPGFDRSEDALTGPDTERVETDPAASPEEPVIGSSNENELDDTPDALDLETEGKARMDAPSDQRMPNLTDESPRTIAVIAAALGNAGSYTTPSAADRPRGPLPSDPVAACDRLAAGPVPGFPAPYAIPFANLIATSDRAVISCRAAREVDPTSPRHAYHLGRALLASDAAPAEIVASLGRAADSAFAPAQNALGVAYSLGFGTSRDMHRALDLFRQAAASGYPPAMVNEAVIYLRSDTGRTDFGDALALLRQAADAGDPVAATQTGIMYQNALGVPGDLSEARRAFITGAERGDVEAIRLLAELPHEQALWLPMQQAAIAAGDRQVILRALLYGSDGVDLDAARAALDGPGKSAKWENGLLYIPDLFGDTDLDLFKILDSERRTGISDLPPDTISDLIAIIAQRHDCTGPKLFIAGPSRLGCAE